MSDWHEWRSAPHLQYAVVGDPVSHSLSPRMQNAAFVSLGLPDRYTAVRVPRSEFDEAMAHLLSVGYKGVNVTVPLKEAAYRWARHMPRTESRMGVVNTLRLEDRTGINTDAPGFMDTLRDLGVPFPAQVLVLGAGGAAAALVVAMSEAGFKLRCWNRTRTNLERLLHSIRIEAEIVDKPDPSGCQLVLNATSASMEDAHLPVDWYLAPGRAIAYDVFYTEGPTTFMFDAQSNGIKAVDGRAMLVAQGARSFEWWTGMKAPKEDMLRAIE